MKKFFFASLILSLFLFSAAGQEKSITILDFMNNTGDASGASLTHTTRSIIETGIKYIGTFKVLSTPSFKIGTDKKSLKEYAELTSSDYVLFGMLSPAKNGTSSLENDLYCRADDTIYHARESIENVLDIFSASDSISLKILSELYKTKIAYGTISIKAEPGHGNYDVFINDVLAGSNCPSISNVPDGNKTVRVISRSGKDDGKVLFSDRVFVKANGSTLIAPIFPQEVARAPIGSGKGLLTITSDPPGMTVSVDKGDAVQTPVTLEVAPGTHTFESNEPIVNNRYYESLPVQWVTVLAGAEAVIPLKLIPQTGSLDCSLIPPGCSLVLDGAEIPYIPAEPVQIPAGFYAIEIRKDGEVKETVQASILRDETYPVPWGLMKAAAFRVDEHQISFKTNSDSWESIIPVYSTNYAHSFLGSDKYGVKTVRFARDKKYFYWHVEFKEINPLKSVPKGANGNVDLLLQIENLESGKYLHLDLNSTWDNAVGLSDYDGKNYASQGYLLSKVSTDRSVTGRIELSTLRKYCKSIYNVSMSLGNNQWTSASYSSIGWVDFSFPEK